MPGAQLSLERSLLSRVLKTPAADGGPPCERCGILLVPLAPDVIHISSSEHRRQINRERGAKSNEIMDCTVRAGEEERREVRAQQPLQVGLPGNCGGCGGKGWAFGHGDALKQKHCARVSACSHTLRGKPAPSASCSSPSDLPRTRRGRREGPGVLHLFLSRICPRPCQEVFTGRENRTHRSLVCGH